MGHGFEQVVVQDHLWGHLSDSLVHCYPRCHRVEVELRHRVVDAAGDQALAECAIGVPLFLLLNGKLAREVAQRKEDKTGEHLGLDGVLDFDMRLIPGVQSYETGFHFTAWL